MPVWYFSRVEKWTTSQAAFHHLSPVAAEIFIQSAIYNNVQFTAAVCIIHLLACLNAFPLFLKRNWIMGGLRQDSSIFFPRFLTNGNILILAFIPQDWKYNFMITSLREPCLIISNYAVRHLVHSVSPTMQPEQQLARCSVCVQSPWYHRWACSPILAGYNTRTNAVVLIIQYGIVQEGVYSVSSSSLFSPICYAVYPNMEHGVFKALHEVHGGRLALIVRENRIPYKRLLYVCAYFSLECMLFHRKVWKHS